jgi:ABC-type nitrate/sulfonate/bicarbonate transport system substrate-binding protein
VHLWIARDLGIFAKYGLDAKLLFISGGPTSLQALLGGDVQVITAGGQATIAAAAKGASVVIFGNSHVTPYVLLTAPSITTIDGIRGKVIGSSRPGAAADFTLRVLLTKLGIDPNRHVTIIPTGLSRSRDRVMLLTQGKMDATLTSVEDVIEIQNKGFKLNIVADSLDVGAISSEDFTATRNFIQSRRSTVAAFLKSVSEAVWLARRDKDLAFKFFRRYLKMDEPSVLESMYKTYVFKSFPDKPYPIVEAIETYIEQLSLTIPELKGKKVADFVNSDVVSAIDKEGFWDKLKR